MYRLSISLLALVFSFGTFTPALASSVSVMTEKKMQNYLSLSGIAPGNSFVRVVRVFNPYSEDHVVQLHAVDVSGSDNFFPLKDPTHAQTSIGKWVQTGGKITIPALGSIGVPLNIKVASYAPLGTYAGGILVEDLTSGDITMKMRLYLVVDEEPANGKKQSSAYDSSQETITSQKVAASRKEATATSGRLLRNTPVRDQADWQEVRVKDVRNFTQPVSALRPRTLFLNDRLNNKLRRLRVVEDTKKQNERESARQEYLRKRQVAMLRRTITDRFGRDF